MSLMGLDIGTTGTKAVVFDAEARIAASAYREYDLHSSRAGWLELNPNQVWRRVKEAVADAAAQAERDPVQAVALSCLGEAAVPLDRQGRVIGPSIVGFDNRALPLFNRWMTQQDPNRIMRVTGMPPSQMYTLVKLMWVKKNCPEVYRSLWKYPCYEDFAIFKMGFAPTIDWTVAARTMAFDVRKKTWSDEICSAAKLSPAVFSELVSPGQVVGELGARASRELGLPKGCRVVTGGHDQPVGALGAGVTRGGVAMNATGTVECIALAFPKPVLNERMRKSNFCCYPHAAPGLYVTLAFNLTGGQLLKWFRDRFGEAQKQEAERRGVDVYDLLLADLPKEPTDLFVLPHFTMTGTPHMDADPIGAFIGLNLSTTRTQVVKAILEGITYEMKLNLDLLRRAGVELEEVRAIGGGAKSDHWLQLKADMFGKKVVRLEVTEAVSLGSALLAGVAIGEYPSLDSAVEQFVKRQRTFRPNPKRAAAYEENLARYARLYGTLKEWRDT